MTAPTNTPSNKDEPYKPHRIGLHSDDRPYAGEEMCYCDQPKPNPTPSNNELDDEQTIFMLLTIVRDAGAIDDNNGAEDWSHSDKAVQNATQNILNWANNKVIAWIEDNKNYAGQLLMPKDEVERAIEALRKKGDM